MLKRPDVMPNDAVTDPKPATAILHRGQLFGLLSASGLLFALSAPTSAADLDLNRAVVVTPPNLSGPAAKAAQMLVEEVEARSMVRWERSEAWPAAGMPVVVIGPADEVRKLLDKQSIKLPAAASP